MQLLLSLLFVFLWSTGFIGAKFGLPYAEPLTFLLVRYGLVVSLMLVLVFVRGAPWPRQPRQWLHIGISGILVHGLYLGGVFMSIRHGLPAGLAALVVGMQPLLTALAAGWLLGEPVVPRQWLGLALGFVGVGLVVSGKLAQGQAAVASMFLPALVALAGITAGTLYQKRFCARFDLPTGAVLQFVPAALLTLPVALATETMSIQWTDEFVFALLWLVLALSIGAISLLNVLIRKGSAVNVARLFYLTPAVTALIAWVLFNETLGSVAMAGMGLAVAGVYLAREDV